MIEKNIRQIEFLSLKEVSAKDSLSLSEAENSFSLAVPSSFYPCLGKYSSQCRWYLKLSVGFISRTNLPAPESSQVSCNNWYPQSLQTWPACSLRRHSHTYWNNNWGNYPSDSNIRCSILLLTCFLDLRGTWHMLYCLFVSRYFISILFTVRPVLEA